MREGRGSERRMEREQKFSLGQNRNHFNALGRVREKQKQLEMIGKVGGENYTRYAERSALLKRD